MRFLLTIDELVALVRAKATLAADGQQECVDALNAMLKDSALDVSTAD